MKVITDKNRWYMHTIIKIAVVSVLALFAIVGVVSISKAEAKNQLKAVNADELLYAQKNGAILIDVRSEKDKRKLLWEFLVF